MAIVYTCNTVQLSYNATVIVRVYSIIERIHHVIQNYVRKTLVYNWCTLNRQSCAVCRVARAVGYVLIYLKQLNLKSKGIAEWHTLHKQNKSVQSDR